MIVVSHRLSEFVEPPKVVQQLDWVTLYWPKKAEDEDEIASVSAAAAAAKDGR